MTSIVPYYIKRSSASMFNISLASQIFYSFIVEVIYDSSKLKEYEYYIGFALIIIGIYIFNMNDVIPIVQTTPLLITDNPIFMENIDSADIKCESNENLNNSIRSDDSNYLKQAQIKDKYTYYKDERKLSTIANKYISDQIF